MEMKTARALWPCNVDLLRNAVLTFGSFFTAIADVVRILRFALRLFFNIGSLLDSHGLDFLPFVEAFVFKTRRHTILIGGLDAARTWETGKATAAQGHQISFFRLLGR